MNNENPSMVGIHKVSSLGYLNAIFDCYEQRHVAMPIVEGQPPPAGYHFARVITPDRATGWFTRTFAPIIDDSPAQVSLSSGTTGPPKAMLLSHRALADVTNRLIAALNMEGSVREYLAVPATFSFGLGRARAIAAVGGHLYIPAKGFDAHEFCRMLASGEVNSLSAVPTIARALLLNATLVTPDIGQKLRWLEIGSQLMSAEDKLRVRAMFPAARIVQHYGLTEASRSTFLDVSDADERYLGSVGKPTGGVEIRVDDGGHICIRGPHVADGVLSPMGIEPLADAAGWLRTNDLGRYDDDGNLWFFGRADDVINVGGIKVPANQFESRLNSALGIDDGVIAITSVPDQLRGELVLVAYLVGLDSARCWSASRAVAREFGLGAADIRLVAIADFPRTETGKIQRKSLAKLAAYLPATAALTANNDAIVADTRMSDSEQAIAKIWEDALDVHGVSKDDSFFEIGGDSLSAIMVALRLEQSGASDAVMGLIFDGLSVAQIAAVIDGKTTGETPKRSTAIVLGESINSVRGVFVLLVLLSHWSPFFFVRMGQFGALVSEYLRPVFAIGTPGFAMTFGVGVSFFYMQMADRSYDRFRRTIWRNTMILVLGLIVLAAFIVMRMYLAGDDVFGPIWPERLFYNVILSYLSIVATVPLIIGAAKLTKHALLNCLCLCCAALIWLLLMQYFLAPVHAIGFANLARLMLITPYSYPQMLGAVSIGVAIGLWVKSLLEREQPFAELWQVGVVLILGGLLVILYSGGVEATLRGPQFFVLYAGVLMLLLAAIIRLNFAGSLLFTRRMLMIIGLMSFFVFIGQGIVFELKAIAVLLGSPYVFALAGPVVAFFALGIYAGRRLWKIYFSRSVA